MNKLGLAFLTIGVHFYIFYNVQGKFLMILDKVCSVIVMVEMSIQSAPFIYY
ncbi:DUF6609 family protein [Paenibacillus illinoisensis]|uniref:DUF6609 family protein n=1 Tax=Paenibacillus illinoisensis TaxID=59845 RepID=UPI0037C845D9